MGTKRENEGLVKIISYIAGTKDTIVCKGICRGKEYALKIFDAESFEKGHVRAEVENIQQVKGVEATVNVGFGGAILEGPDNVFVYAMDYVRGTTVVEYVMTARPILTEREAFTLFQNSLQAFQQMWNVAWTHNHLRGSSVMFLPSSRTEGDFTIISLGHASKERNRYNLNKGINGDMKKFAASFAYAVILAPKMQEWMISTNGVGTYKQFRTNPALKNPTKVEMDKIGVYYRLLLRNQVVFNSLLAGEKHFHRVMKISKDAALPRPSVLAQEQQVVTELTNPDALAPEKPPALNPQEGTILTPVGVSRFNPRGTALVHSAVLVFCGIAAGSILTTLWFNTHRHPKYFLMEEI